ncbi:hypothetical protein [Rheinheimera sp. MMS21-TC3]|uniref:hypothetical protein n=1 Tax=Rheinheimera sp. MMS21-TC3 TaxID=3072790 RepID=UPI0028C4F138|nr:hypothetical protein [Rheinheimera sp. MMS21-TC3]WNO59491.1 hypothetical protein RDV63_00550 [Rheinheimera sp. MMS21-TC3]
MRLLGLLLLLISLPLSATKVVVHNSVPLDALTQSQLRSIFTMRQTQWPDGSPIKVYILPEAAPQHQLFSRQQLYLFPYQLSMIWDRLSFSGTGARPTVVADESMMLEQLKITPGSIGYSSFLDTDVRVKELSIEY